MASLSSWADISPNAALIWGSRPKAACEPQEPVLAWKEAPDVPENPPGPGRKPPSDQKTTATANPQFPRRTPSTPLGFHPTTIPSAPQKTPHLPPSLQPPSTSHSLDSASQSKPISVAHLARALRYRIDTPPLPDRSAQHLGRSYLYPPMAHAHQPNLPQPIP